MLPRTEIIQITNQEGYSRNYKITLPKSCPYCNVPNKPTIEYVTIAEEINSKFSSNAILFRCSNCGFYFVHHTVIRGDTISIESLTENPKIEYTFPDNIENLSPRFKEIYQEAQLAEHYNLHNLVGVGYRKSLEFLVKDYLIHFKNNPQEEIQSKPLSQCIDLLEDEKLIALGKSSTWIGNDQAHYVPKHPDKDTTHLKKFIEALVYFVNYELTSNDAALFIAGNSSKGSK